ncbi:MAG: DUF4215 domain-containing protein, partial [bacterium]
MKAKILGTKGNLLVLAAVLGLLGGCGSDPIGGNQNNENTNNTNGNENNPVCGDGVIDPGEECDGSVLGGATCQGRGFDNGALACGDGCTFDETGCFDDPRCGDGNVDAGEVCDDGNNSSGDGCAADCLSNETCGNGVLDVAAGETCDDGNTTGGDGCSATCNLEYCGNNVLDANEICDDGNSVSGDGCSADCQSNETCGNGYVDTAAGEACDDGNTSPGDGCGPTCLLESCGNGVDDPGEVCDDGNNTSGDGCSADCQSGEICGNGYVDNAVGETCDDGNVVGG